MTTESSDINKSFQYILPVHPQEYLYQPRGNKEEEGNCGPRAIAGVVGAFSGTVESYQNYNKYWIGKKLHWMTPYQMVQVINENGLEAKRGNAGKLSEKEKIELLKRELLKNTPVILLVGNGYDSDGNFTTESKARLIPHYVTIYGFSQKDDRSGEFYIYDPRVKKENYTPNIPIGNIARPYHDVIRDWNLGGLPGIPKLGANLFVSVNPKK